jgi:hypothetical protein
VRAAPNRRIWHAEVEGLCAALEELGAWQTALRLRVAQGEAVSRRPAGTAFDYRATSEDADPLARALGQIRAHHTSR